MTGGAASRAAGLGAVTRHLTRLDRIRRQRGERQTAPKAALGARPEGRQAGQVGSSGYAGSGTRPSGWPRSKRTGDSLFTERQNLLAQLSEREQQVLQLKAPLARSASG